MPLSILFPPKCVLCRKLLAVQETDLCHHCRSHAQKTHNSKRNIPFVAQWTAVWYYKGDVQKSIRRFKFHNARHYANAYARLMAVNLVSADLADSFDCITWAPTSALRRFKRGYDQSELLAKALGNELQITPMKLLKKVRHTPAQSTLNDASKRRANVSNAYRITSPNEVVGKRVLLVDDVLTTGSTATECAKMLLMAGAKEVYFASVASSEKE